MSELWPEDSGSCSPGWAGTAPAPVGRLTPASHPQLCLGKRGFSHAPRVLSLHFPGSFPLSPSSFFNLETHPRSLQLWPPLLSAKPNSLGLFPLKLCQIMPLPFSPHVLVLHFWMGFSSLFFFPPPPFWRVMVEV